EVVTQNIEKAEQYLSKISDRIGNAILHRTYAILYLHLNDIPGCEKHIKIAEEIGNKIASPYITGEILTAKIELASKKGEKENALNNLKTLEELCMKYKIKSFDKFIERKKMELEPPRAVVQEQPQAEPIEKVEESPVPSEVGTGKKKRKKKKGGDLQ
ncbi:MAG: hypothetical protein QXD15_04515, partial [Thermoplasmata archaeon]